MVGCQCGVPASDLFGFVVSDIRRGSSGDLQLQPCASEKSRCMYARALAGPYFQACFVQVQSSSSTKPLHSSDTLVWLMELIKVFTDCLSF